MARLVSYIRVSSVGQKDNTSLDGQQERIDLYCKATGHEIVARYRDVESASGSVPRKNFKQALEDVYHDKADGIIVYRLDRFARSAIEGLNVAAELKNRGKQLVILNLNLDTSTPIGACIYTVMLAFAELERNVIQERTQTGKQRVRDRGGYSGGRPPYGWDAAEVNGVRTLVPNEIEQRWLQLIWRWRDEGYNSHQIWKLLKHHGAPTKSGKEWQWKCVRRIVSGEQMLVQWARKRDGDPSNHDQASGA
jgi:site-specific DNA recombinase